jgi:hypothetical protein
VELNVQGGKETIKGTKFQLRFPKGTAEAKLLAALERGWRPGSDQQRIMAGTGSFSQFRQSRLAQGSRRNRKIPCLKIDARMRQQEGALQYGLGA